MVFVKVSIILFLLNEFRCDSFISDTLKKLKRGVISPNFSQLFNYTFVNFHCVQVGSDNSVFSTEIEDDLFRAWGPLLVNTVQDDRHCPGLVFVSSSISSMRSTILEDIYFPRSLIVLPGHIKDHNVDALDYVLKGGEGLVVTVNDVSWSVYRTDLGSPRFTRINLDSGPWSFYKYRHPDFYGRHLELATFNWSFYSMTGPLDKHRKPEWIDGVEMKFMDDLSHIWNFTYSIRIPGNDWFWGFLLPNGTWSGGILRLVNNREADFGFANVWVTADLLLSDMDISNSWETVCIRFLVPRPTRLGAQWSGIFSPFEPTTWILTLAAALFFSLAVNFLSTLSKQHNYQIKRYSNYTDSLLHTLSGLVGILPRSTSQLGILRVAWTSLAFLSILLCSIFSSSLVSHLTRPKFTAKVESIEGLAKEKYTLLSSRRLDIKNIFNMEDKFHQELSLHVTVINEKTDFSKYSLPKNKVAIFSSDLAGAVDVNSMFPENFLDNFEITSKCLKKNRIGIVMHHNSPFKRLMDKYVMAFIESGLFSKSVSDISKAMAKKRPNIMAVFDLSEKRPQSAIPLAVANLKGAFYLLFLGQILAFISFLAEIISYLLFNRKQSTERSIQFIFYYPTEFKHHTR